MIGIEEAYCNTTISALVRANRTLRQATIEEALQTIHVWGKGDTLGLDAITEISIAERIKQFDQYAILVSEERGLDANPLATANPSRDRGPRTYFVSDPCDRSLPLKGFLEAAGDRSATVADVLDREDARALWERDYGAPASITGPFTAITCVRRGQPICSVLLNDECDMRLRGDATRQCRARSRPAGWRAQGPSGRTPARRWPEAGSRGP